MQTPQEPKFITGMLIPAAKRYFNKGMLMQGWGMQKGIGTTNLITLKLQ